MKGDYFYMLQSIDVAKFFLALDANKEVFGLNLITRNGKTFYEGNARLNKYLHISQNLYIAKTGKKLFTEDLFAFDNGAVVPSIREMYMSLRNKELIPVIPDEYSDFLRKIYKILQNATIDELIEISHEDNEWSDKNPLRGNQRMDSLKRIQEYKQQYSDMLIVMDRM